MTDSAEQQVKATAEQREVALNASREVIARWHQQPINNAPDWSATRRAMAFSDDLAKDLAEHICSVLASREASLRARIAELEAELAIEKKLFQTQNDVSRAIEDHEKEMVQKNNLLRVDLQKVRNAQLIESRNLIYLADKAEAERDKLAAALRVIMMRSGAPTGAIPSAQLKRQRELLDEIAELADAALKGERS